jgi:hypothetical protein
VNPTESAVIVPIPEVEPAVGALRAGLDRAAGWGVPAHVTVIYPFLPPDRIGGPELDRLRTAIRSVAAFEVTFVEVRWFDDSVVWLSPDPADPFRALTDAVWGAFPQCPPYAGEHDGSTPHLTVGHDATTPAMEEAGRAAARRLPISASIGAAHLFVGSETAGGWRGVEALPLG